MLEHRQEWCVIFKAQDMVYWTNGSGKLSGILKTTAFFAVAMRLWASVIIASKKRSVVVRWLVVISMDGSMRLGDGDIFYDKSLICCALVYQFP